ncbi:MAG: type secretion system protein [Dehalococcoidia bacterium]|nr:type secretion system protein [Dehalococcoidia bacterium]
MSLLRRLETASPPPPTRHEDAPASAPKVEERRSTAATAPPAAAASPPPPPPAPVRAEAPAAPRDRSREKDLRMRVQDRLLKELKSDADANNEDKVKEQLKQLFDKVLDEEGAILGRADRERLYEGIEAEIIGLGPIDHLTRDVSVSEIMVCGPKKVFVERRGKLVLTDIEFDDNDHVKRIIERIIAPLGRRCDESSPYVDARLKDGSRVHAIIPPLALDGPTVTIRKFSAKPLQIEDLVRFGSVTYEMGEFLRACVMARLNIIVSGGTGSGKTTLLNVLSSFIPDDERIITCEDAAELQLQQVHWVRLETRKPNIEGKGAVTIRDLVMNTLRMRPDRVVIGECRGGESLDMVQAMNTGHDGSLTTLHANTPKDALGRLEVMCMMSGMDLPLSALRKQIASAVHLVVQQQRLHDGSRRVTYITEIQGMEGENVITQDIFRFEQEGIDEETGKIIGATKPTGLRPTFMHKIHEVGIELPPGIFGEVNI